MEAPPNGYSGPTLNSLIESIQHFAAPRGYAVVKARTKKDPKNDLIRRAWIRCDRGGKEEKNSKSKDLRNTSSRLLACEFMLIATPREEADGGAPGGDWVITVKNPHHNHKPTGQGSHPSLRKLAMTPSIMNTIQNRSKEGDKPAKILNSLYLSHDENNPIWKASDIYNAKSKIRTQELGVLTPVEALIRDLNRTEDWFCEVSKNRTTQAVKFLFFTSKTQQQMLRINPEVLIMDCTYKTNRYRLPLLVITGVTSLNTSFYAGFAFMPNEDALSYEWVLEQVKKLYTQLEIPLPQVILTDHEKALIKACGWVFPTSSTMPCIWHIERNLLKNCREYFDEKGYESFNKSFSKILYANTENDYKEACLDFYAAYGFSHYSAVSYVEDQLLPYRSHWVQYWTKNHLSFGNRATSRGENNNRRLKQQLNKYSTSDLSAVIKAIQVLISIDLSKYNRRIEEYKMERPKDLRKPVFRDLFARVTPNAIRLILPQYELVIGNNMKPCTESFTNQWGLPCSHKIQARMLGEGGVLAIEDIHPHWRFKQPHSSNNMQPAAPLSEAPPPDTGNAYNDEILQTNEPAVATPKGRPRGALGKKRNAQQAFDDSTQREPSGFEYVEQEFAATTRAGSATATRGRGSTAIRRGGSTKSRRKVTTPRSAAGNRRGGAGGARRGAGAPARKVPLPSGGAPPPPRDAPPASATPGEGLQRDTQAPLGRGQRQRAQPVWQQDPLCDIWAGVPGA